LAGTEIEKELVQARYDGDGEAVHVRQVGHIRVIVFAVLGGVEAKTAGRSIRIRGARRGVGGPWQK
jgi:hypothetical protein